VSTPRPDKYLHVLGGFIREWDAVTARHLGEATLDAMPRTRDALLAASDPDQRHLWEHAPPFTLDVTRRTVRVIVDGEKVCTIERQTAAEIADRWAAWKGAYDGDY